MNQIQPQPDMQQFIGIKLVNAKPMTRKEYNDFRGWELPADENPADEGMLVEYVDGGKANTEQYKGYVSWSPLEVFQKAYGHAAEMTFGLAIEAAKRGVKIQRESWKEVDMWVVVIPAGNKKMVDADGTQYPFHDSIMLKAWDGKMMPWVPSVNDILSTDWEVVISEPTPA